MANLLDNPGFETDWADDSSHHCLIIPKDTPPHESDIDNIFTPSGWNTWFVHDPDTWDQPEVRDAWKQNDPQRVHGGQKGMLLFTFGRKHNAGFFQQVHIAPGTQLRLTAWAHAWSNHKDKSQPEKFPHPDDGNWSEGAGYGAGFHLDGEAPNDNWRNFTFYVGIDPTGGTNPLADTVVWGQGAHIYNEYAQVPPAEATAQADTITVFLRSKALWPFKHNDAYWDDAELVVVNGNGEEVVAPKVNLNHRPANPKVGETVTIEARSLTGITSVSLVIRQPSGTTLAQSSVVVERDGDWHTWTYTTDPLNEVGGHEFVFAASDGVEVTGAFESTPPTKPKPQRGLPRTQYERTYLLMPPNADAAWMLAALTATYHHRYTIGGSADDAGIGDLDSRRVIAVNPTQWPDNLRAFFEKYYPGVEYCTVTATAPEDLASALFPQPPPLPLFPLRGVHDLAGADWMITENLQGWVTEAVYLGTSPRDLHLRRYADAGIRVIVRLSYSYAVDDGGAGTMPGPHKLQSFERACIQTMQANPHAWAFLYCNEMNNSREWPRGYDLTPSYYTSSYNEVWTHKPPNYRLFPGAIDPYNPGWGDWRTTWRNVLDRITDCDGLALHAYTHGPELHKIWHDKRFGSPPLAGIFYDLRVLESQQAIIPTRFAGKPQIITETNHLTDTAGTIGWEPDAGKWVEDTMKYFRTRGIAGVCLFRYDHVDWAFRRHEKILQALRETT